MKKGAEQSLRITIPEPRIARFLFSDVRTAWLWLAIRLFVGYQWLSAGIHKLQNPAWFGSDAGAAVSGFLQGSLEKTVGSHPDVSWWYSWFVEHIALPHTEFFSHVIVIGEILVGIALILGIFTGIAAFFGSFMNLNFMFAGAVSTNPILLVLQLFLILAWRVSGWIGVDRWLLPKLGTPWYHEKKK